MANYYTSQSIANYNDDAPADDGTESEANRVKYATIKTELADPLKTLAEAIDTELGNFEGRLFLNNSTTQSTNYTVQASDLGKVIVCSNAITITLLVAASATEGFIVTIFKSDAGGTVVTIDGNGSETIDGQTTYLLGAQYSSVTLRCDGSNWTIIAGKKRNEWEAIQTQTASSSATIDFSALYSSVYGSYRFRILNAIPATDDQALQLRIGTGGTPTYQSGASDYGYAGSIDYVTPATSQFGDSTAAHGLLCAAGGGGFGVGNGASEGICLTVEVDNLDSAALLKKFYFRGSYFSATQSLISTQGTCAYTIAATAITAVRFFFASGNIASGTFIVEGLRK